ncbi:hypothetical protein BF49_2566 [Bradyrhizobium sp.]|nr:hypothetical protein BF49_2566 [Bradyrhizobium sp.]
MNTKDSSTPAADLAELLRLIEEDRAESAPAQREEDCR